MSASYQSYSSTFHSLEEQQVDLALDVGSEYSIVKVIKLQFMSQVDPVILGLSAPVGLRVAITVGLTSISM